MRSLKVVIAVLQQGDIYHLQLRSGTQQTGETNKIGCFGGKVEIGETPRSAIVREITEETNLTPSPNDLKYLGCVDVVAEHKTQELVNVRAEVFGWHLPNSVVVAATEGDLVSLQSDDITGSLERMTPATKACFQDIIKIRKDV